MSETQPPLPETLTLACPGRLPASPPKSDETTLPKPTPPAEFCAMSPPYLELSWTSAVCVSGSL